MVFFLEPYQLFLLFFKTLIRCINLRFDFSLKVFWREQVWFFIQVISHHIQTFSCFLRSSSSVSHKFFSSLADESIMILCCLSWYVSLNCWSYYFSLLLLWSHCYWKIFTLLDKEPIKSFGCLSINILCCLSWYVSLNYCISSPSCLLLWSHCFWNSFSSMAKESINSFSSDLWLYGGSMASHF